MNEGGWMGVILDGCKGGKHERGSQAVGGVVQVWGTRGTGAAGRVGREMH